MRYGHYEVLEKLGEGSFGAVFRACDSRTGAVVALKVLKDKAYLERFQREARLLYDQLRNRHIAKLLDHSLNSNPPYIVTEFCSGGSLRNWVGRSTPWQQSIRAIRHAAVGLSAIHATGGFHRDVKPDNLLLWASVEGKTAVKLCDLGVGRGAATFLAPHATTSAMGTEGYMAPEILVGGRFTASADMYSLGVTALELLTGGRNIAGLWMAPCPDDVKKLVQSLLHPKPSARPTAFNVASALLKISGRSAWTLQAPSPPQTDWGGLLVLGAVAVGAAALLKGK